MCFKRRRNSLSVFTPFPRDAASPICLLFGSGSLYRRPPHPILSTTTRWREIIALSSCIVGRSRIFFGVVLSRSSHVSGSVFIPTPLVQKKRNPVISFPKHRLPLFIEVSSKVLFLNSLLMAIVLSNSLLT